MERDISSGCRSPSWAAYYSILIQPKAYVPLSSMTLLATESPRSFWPLGRAQVLEVGSKHMMFTERNFADWYISTGDTSVCAAVGQIRRFRLLPGGWRKNT